MGIEKIKQSVVNDFYSEGVFDLHDALLVLLFAVIIGIYVFCVYKYFTKAAFYSQDMNTSIAGMCVATAAIMIAMQSNLLVSLGMVGALSIVRFRTAVKNPLDLLYLFWSISCGIISGVGLYTLTLLLCALMTVMIWLLGRIPVSKAPGLLIIRTEAEADQGLLNRIINEKTQYYHLSSSGCKNGQYEIVYEIRTKDATELLSSLQMVDHVQSINYLVHDGELRG